MRSLDNRKKSSKQTRRRTRQRVLSILTAVVVFLTTYALVLPAITMDTETASQEPGIEIAQPAPEAAVPEPVPTEAEPVSAEPIAAVPVAVETVPADTAVQPAAEPVPAEMAAQPAADTGAEGTDGAGNAGAIAGTTDAASDIAAGDPAATEITDGSTPQAGSEISASSEQGAAAVTDETAAADPFTASSDTAAETGENPGGEVKSSSESNETGNEDEKEAEKKENEEDKEDKEKEDEDGEEKDEQKLSVSPLVCDGPEYTVTVSFSESAQIPEGAAFTWREFPAGSVEYAASRKFLDEKLIETGIAQENLTDAVSSARFFELLFKDKDGAQFLPADAVDVLVEYKAATNLVTDESLYAVTFRTDDGQPTKANLITTNAKDGSAGVEAAGGVIQKLRVQNFPVNDPHTNAVIGQVAVKAVGVEDSAVNADEQANAESGEVTEPGIITTKDDEEEAVEEEADSLTTQYLTADGEAYNITLTYGPDAGIPDDAQLSVSEIIEASDTYNEYVSKTENALDPAEKVVFARFFDIKIMKDGAEIQPNGIVNVKIELADALTEDVKVVHFEHNDAVDAVETIDTPVVLDSERVEAETLWNAVGFETESFSVFGVVETESISTPFMASDGNTYEVIVDYDENAGIPENAKLEVSEVTEDNRKYAEYVEQTAEAIDTRTIDLEYVKLLDISIVSENGSKITLNAPVNVQIKLLDKEQAESTTQVVHFEGEEENPVVMESNVRGDSVNFSTDGFSIYAVVDEGSTGEYARMNLHFMNGTTEVAKMIVKNGDTREELNTIIYDPGVGNISEGTIFKGWSTSADYTVADAENGMDIDEVRDWVEGLTITENEDRYVYAMLYKNFVVNYLDENNVGVGSDNVFMLSSDTSSPYTVNMSYTPKDDTHAFLGWNVAEGGSHISGYTDGTQYQNGDEITISGNVTFSVNAPEGHWLVFEENGKGAAYNAPVFVKSEDRTTAPPAPTRFGYTFGGWYTQVSGTEDENGYTPVVESSRFTFGNTINDKTTLYAKWTPVQRANYTVIIWKQNVEANGYDFAEAITLTGNTGSAINTVAQQGTGDSAYARINGTNKQYNGFYLKQFDQNVKITPEGDAVLNVYYDRIQYTLRFYYARSYRYNNRTYVQVNCNDEGFLSGKGSRSVSDSLTRVVTNDYGFFSGSNTWKDVNANGLNGDATKLITDSYKQKVTLGSENIGNYNTYVVGSNYTGENNDNATNRSVSMTYYYFDVNVYYGQSVVDVWPVPSEETYNIYRGSGYNTRSNWSGQPATGIGQQIRPIHQGFYATGNGVSGLYSTVDPEMFVDNMK